MGAVNNQPDTLNLALIDPNTGAPIQANQRVIATFEDAFPNYVLF